jgi:hypothetical protein
MRSRLPFWPALLLLSLGSLLCVHSRAPFRRIHFVVPCGIAQVRGTAVIPRGLRTPEGYTLPVVIYVHGAKGSIITDGHVLRRLSEVGLAAISFDYDEINTETFAQQFSGLLDWVVRQEWADTNRVAWIGFSLGAQNTLQYLLRHSDHAPQIYVRLAGGWISEPNSNSFRTLTIRPTLLVHGENDSIFPLEEAKRLAKVIGTNATLKILSGESHSFEADQAVVFRLVGEWCKARFNPMNSLPVFPKVHRKLCLIWIAPACFWAGLWLWISRSQKPVPAQRSVKQLSVVFRIASWLSMLLALADVVLRFLLTTMGVNSWTLQMAREHLLGPTLRGDFDALASLSIWKEQRLGTLLTHVELAHYTAYELVNWKIDAQVYRYFVLSPLVEVNNRELSWRRELWEDFWPRVRHENTATDAARIVVQHLRERVTISTNYPKQNGITSIWDCRIANLDDFNIVYAAALRSVGVGARLNNGHSVELWNGSAWSLAPLPLATSWAE